MTLDSFFFFMAGVLIGGIGIMVLHYLRPITRFDRAVRKRKREKDIIGQ